MVDQNNNVQAVFEVNGEQHVITLNAKLTGRGITHYMPFYMQILHVLNFFSLSKANCFLIQILPCFLRDIFIKQACYTEKNKVVNSRLQFVLLKLVFMPKDID